jgi:hypothetical protein
MGQPAVSVHAKRGRKKKRHAGGRPSKFSAELVVSICNLLKKGYFRKDACMEIGITYQTMFLWLKRGEAEKDMEEIERSDYFQFWDSVQDIESSKRELCEVSKSVNYSDSHRPGVSEALESCPTVTEEQYQIHCYDEIINKNPFIIKVPTDKQKLFLMQGIPKRNVQGAGITPIEVFFNGALILR